MAESDNNKIEPEEIYSARIRERIARERSLGISQACAESLARFHFAIFNTANNLREFANPRIQRYYWAWPIVCTVLGSIPVIFLEIDRKSKFWSDPNKVLWDGDGMLTRNILVAIATAVVLGLGYLVKLLEKLPTIIVASGDKEEAFILGKGFHLFCSFKLVTTIVVSAICFLFSFHVSVIGLCHSNLGLERSWITSFLIAADNLCHGVFLDVFEIFGIHLVSGVKHTLMSSTEFLLFRITYDALLLFLIYGIYKHRQTVRILASVELKSDADLRQWLDKVCSYSKSWFGSTPDLVIFLIILSQYLDRNFENARFLALHFPNVVEDQNIRKLFIDADGSALFPQGNRSERGAAATGHPQS